MSATLALRDVPEVARMDASVLARVLGALLQATVLCAGLAAALTVEARRQLSPPGVVPLDLYSVFARTDLVQVTVRAGWTPLIAWVPYDTVLRDPTLWRRMQFQDWDRLDEAPREAGLQAMVARYGHVREEAVWPTMRAVDWDAVPQPVRAMAYLEMAAYWARHYGVGHEYGLSPALVGDTLGAIIMVESWFEHRSAVTGESGNLDVGIGQCSDYCRAALVRRAAAGHIDFAPATLEAYGNPLHASRAAALWLAIMLDEADGDLELAVRAYYRGMPAARAGEGSEYLRNVLDKRERFVRNQAGTPAWRAVYRQLR